MTSTLTVVELLELLEDVASAFERIAVSLEELVELAREEVEGGKSEQG